MSLEPGELVGYIGPNGAGKSTTIKMLTGILVPTSGSSRRRPRPVRTAQRKRAQHRRRLRTTQPTLLGSAADRVVRTASGDLRHSARPLPPKSRRVRRDAGDGRLPAHAGAAAFARTAHARRFCGGACCTIRDRLSRRTDDRTRRGRKEAIRGFIARINNERGTTIILTTHDLADVERLCRRIVLIDTRHDHLRRRFERIKTEYGRFRTLAIRFSRTVPVAAARRRRTDRLHRGQRRALSVRPQPRASRPADSQGKRALSSRRRSIEEPELESIIRRIYVEGYDARRRSACHDFFQQRKKPKIHSSAYVAPSATVSGDVTDRRGVAPSCTAR